MTSVLIGSRAINYWLPEFKIRPDTDYDVISETAIPGTEWHRPDVLNNQNLLSIDGPTIEFNDAVLTVAPLNVLAAIKRSHLHRPLGFGKHITHYHKHLKPYLDDSVSEFLEERKALTLKEFPQQGPNLRQTVRDFFDDAVEKVYDHDLLHHLFAYSDAPMYTKMQRDPSVAWCEKSMWDTFSHQEKLWTVAEETMVIATERVLVPSKWEYPTGRAFNRAIEKVCTTLCSGWFRDFAIEHYPEVLGMHDSSLFLNVKSKLEKLK